MYILTDTEGFADGCIETEGEYDGSDDVEGFDEVVGEPEGAEDFVGWLESVGYEEYKKSVRTKVTCSKSAIYHNTHRYGRLSGGTWCVGRRC